MRWTKDGKKALHFVGLTNNVGEAARHAEIEVKTAIERFRPLVRHARSFRQLKKQNARLTSKNREHAQERARISLWHSRLQSEAKTNLQCEMRPCSINIISSIIRPSEELQ